MSFNDILSRVSHAVRHEDDRPTAYVKAQGATGRVDGLVAPVQAPANDFAFAANDIVLERPHVIERRSDRKARREARSF